MKNVVALLVLVSLYLFLLLDETWLAEHNLGIWSWLSETHRVKLWYRPREMVGWLIVGWFLIYVMVAVLQYEYDDESRRKDHILDGAAKLHGLVARTTRTTAPSVLELVAHIKFDGSLYMLQLDSIGENNAVVDSNNHVFESFQELASFVGTETPFLIDDFAPANQ